MIDIPQHYFSKSEV